MFEKIMGLLLRHGIAGWGVVLADDGLMTEDDLQLVIGAAMTIFGIAWSVFEKWMARKKTKEILQQPRGYNQ